MTKFEELVLEDAKEELEGKIAQIENYTRITEIYNEISELKAELETRNMIKILLENGVSAELIKKASTIN